MMNRLYPQNIQQESEDWDPHNQPPGAEKVFTDQQDNEGVENRQFSPTRHELRIQNVGFQGMNDGNHNQNIDNVTHPTYRISDHTEGNQRNDDPSNWDQWEQEHHQGQCKDLRHVHEDQADSRDQGVADSNEELGFQHDPKGIYELFAKEINVLEEPAKVTSLERPRKFIHLFQF